jgi:hypothetical protein
MADDLVAHTPGPWSISPISDTIINGGGHPLGFVYAPAVESFLLQRARADARLFAAAPELLQSVREILGWYVEGGHAVPRIFIERANDAIAKAEGRSNG